MGPSWGSVRLDGGWRTATPTRKDARLSAHGFAGAGGRTPRHPRGIPRRRCVFVRAWAPLRWRLRCTCTALTRYGCGRCACAGSRRSPRVASKATRASVDKGASALRASGCALAREWSALRARQTVPARRLRRHKDARFARDETAGFAGAERAHRRGWRLCASVNARARALGRPYRTRVFTRRRGIVTGPLSGRSVAASSRAHRRHRDGAIRRTQRRRVVDDAPSRHRRCRGADATSPPCRVSVAHAR